MTYNTVTRVQNSKGNVFSSSKIFRALDNERAYNILLFVAMSGNADGHTIRQKFNLTSKVHFTAMRMLVEAGLIRRDKGLKYRLSLHGWLFLHNYCQGCIWS
jgi:predicted transcriptional regulator